MLPLNIRVDRNCQPTRVTQNAIPEEQELIALGGGHDSPPPPYRHRVNEENFVTLTLKKFAEGTAIISKSPS